MIVKLNGVPDWWKGPITQVVEDNVQSPWELIVSWFTDKAEHLFTLLNASSPEVITIGIVACAFGLMISPMSSGGGKWMGRMFLVFWGGVVWRMLT